MNEIFWNICIKIYTSVILPLRSADPIKAGATGKIKILCIKMKIVLLVLYLGKSLRYLSFTPLQYISEETAALSWSVYFVDLFHDSDSIFKKNIIRLKSALQG